jgi:hypothetical protein
MAKLRGALHLLSAEGWLLARAWWLLLAADLGLRQLPFVRVQRLFAVRCADGAPPERAVLRRAARCVDVAARHHLWPMTCLRRALVLQRLLAERGLQTTLRFGVRREGERLAAHAWLEGHGLPLAEAEGIAERYAPLVAAPHP